MKKIFIVGAMGTAITLCIFAGISIASAALTFSSTSMSGDGSVVIDGASTIAIGSSTATGITIGQSGQALSLPGNVGIGTTSPNSKLEVTATQLVGAQSFYTPAGGATITYGHDLGIQTNAKEDYSLDKPIVTIRTPNGLLGTGVGAQTALMIEAEGWSPTNGVAIEMGHITASTRIISYGNIASNNGSFLQIQTGQGNGGWNNGLLMDRFGAVSIGGAIATNFPNMFNVGSTSQFQINSSGAITAAAGITSSGSITFSSLTAGSIPYIGTGGLISQDNSNLFYDATNHRLGIDTATPATTLQLSGTLPTLRIGASSLAGCLEMGNSDGSAGINYITVLNGTIAASTTKPAACQ